MTTISVRQGWPLLLLFVVGVIGIGFVVGLLAAPGDYVATQRMPDIVLPPPLSTLLWLLLCVAFAVAGWRLWTVDPSSFETRLWLGILILSWWYAPVFHLMHSPELALLIISGMGAAMALFILRVWNSDRVSALLFIPCFLWVGYAAAMTAAIVVLN